MEELTIKEDNFYQMVKYLGLKLCGGYSVIVKDKQYKFVDLPDFLADMNHLKKIDSLIDYFLPCLVHIKHIQINNLSEYIDLNSDWLDGIKETYKRLI